MKCSTREERYLKRLLEKLGLDNLSEDPKLLNRAYNRILTSEERKLLDTESFGYLLSLYQIGTIDCVKLERFIDHCLCIAYYEEESLPLERTKKIVNMLLFCDNLSLRNRDFARIFIECEEEINTYDIVH